MSPTYSLKIADHWSFQYHLPKYGKESFWYVWKVCICLTEKGSKHAKMTMSKQRKVKLGAGVHTYDDKHP